MKHLILLIEGKRADRPSYMAGLSKKGYEVESVSNGTLALEVLNRINPKAVIVDAASMRTTGTRICKSIRSALAKTPIMLVVSEDQQGVDENCADQVLRLPFTLQKLVNRLRPYMSMNENKKLECGPIRLDVKERWLYCNGKKTRLTPRLYILMEAFMMRPGEVHSREELFKKIWETDYLGDTRSLDVHISWLIKTERGIGYRLEVEKAKRPVKADRK
jgi:DNA-binding response OmpR family regulator